MGFLSRFINRGEQQSQQEDDFVDLIRALDNKEEWAKKQIGEMWRRNDPTLFSRMNEARIKIYASAAQQGDPKAQYWMGMSLSATDKQASLGWLVPLANQGNIEAMTAIALGYTEYGGYGDNKDEYRYWYMKAAEAGDADAQATIGLEYLIEQNYEEALNWYIKSADQGYAKGLIGVSKCLEHKRDNLSFDPIYSEPQARQQEEQRLNDIIEDTYIDAVNAARKEDELGEAFNGLGHFYMRSLIVEGQNPDIAKRAAYFLYKAYLLGNDFALQCFNEVVSENKLYVDINDIEEWAEKERLFG